MVRKTRRQWEFKGRRASRQKAPGRRRRESSALQGQSGGLGLAQEGQSGDWRSREGAPFYGATRARAGMAPTVMVRISRMVEVSITRMQCCSGTSA